MNKNNYNGLKERRIFAENCYVSNDDIHSGFNNNDLIIGGSGSGKTGGYVIPNIRKANGSVVVADTKSLLYHKLKDEMIAKGFKVKVLDFANMECSNGYNPLDAIRENPLKHSVDRYSNRDIVSIARALCPESFEKDPFWTDSARTVLTFLVAFTMEALIPEEHTLMSVLELYRVLNNEKERDMIDKWCEKHPESFASKKYRMFRGIMEVDRTWSCITQVVAESLDIFEFGEMTRIIENTEEKIDIRALGHEKTILFLNVSDTNRSVDRIVNLFYTQVMQLLCDEADSMEDGRLPVSVRIILDDFAANVYISDFDKLISVIRSRNICTSVILQNITQLNSMYSEGQASTIMSNCDHMLYLGGQDLDTANYISIRANKPVERILSMPFEKAYFIERGKLAKLVEKVKPYATLEEGKEAYEEEYI